MTSPRLILALTTVLAGPACGHPTPHPLATLAIPAGDAPSPCELATDARPMYMLPNDKTWRVHLKMTAGWWLGPEVPDTELDAALSHMLRLRGEDRKDRPAILVVAMRFRDPAIARDVQARLEYRVDKPPPRFIALQGRVLILMPATSRASEDCALAFWREELLRLREVPQ